MIGVLLGLLGGGGLALAVAYAPPLRTPRLDDRLAPYLRDTPRPSRLLAEPLLRPLLREATALLDRWLGGANSLRRRLAQAGRGMTLEEFRAEQVVWGALGLLAGLAISGLALATERAAPLALLACCLGLAAFGVLGRDRWLAHEVTRREERMLAELPTIAELLALAVTAGEGAVGALERVCRIGSGELTAELAMALAEARTGGSLVSALEGVAARTSLPALARFADGVAIAVERGTPLADVLRAQAVDVREAGRRALLEAGGRKEIGMLVPVVFLVLPVTVLFALFPGFYGLRLLTP
ncbi:MAG: tight adherence protein [Frankiaceae bacterium]|nr:tight adherence protein [Frankiaceae bacterium]